MLKLLLRKSCTGCGFCSYFSTILQIRKMPAMRGWMWALKYSRLYLNWKRCTEGVGCMNQEGEDWALLARAGNCRDWEGPKRNPRHSQDCWSHQKAGRLIFCTLHYRFSWKVCWLLSERQWTETPHANHWNPKRTAMSQAAPARILYPLPSSTMRQSWADSFLWEWMWGNCQVWPNTPVLCWCAF